MSFFRLFNVYFRVPRFLLSFTVLLAVSVFALAQVTLKFRMLPGYSLTSEAPVNKGKPTLFVFEQDETFSRVFKPVPTTGKRSDPTATAPNFSREMVLGVTIPTTNKPPKLSVSKVFVQDSVLTVRYIRIADTTKITPPQSSTVQPMLLLAIPKQTVLKTRLVENGKVVQVIQKRPED